MLLSTTSPSPSKKGIYKRMSERILPKLFLSALTLIHVRLTLIHVRYTA